MIGDITYVSGFIGHGVNTLLRHEGPRTATFHGVHVPSYHHDESRIKECPAVVLFADHFNVNADGRVVLGNRANVTGNRCFVYGSDARVSGSKCFIVGHRARLVEGANDCVVFGSVAQNDAMGTTIVHQIPYDERLPIATIHGVDHWITVQKADAADDSSEPRLDFAYNSRPKGPCASFTHRQLLEKYGDYFNDKLLGGLSVYGFSVILWDIYDDGRHVATTVDG